jgi:hypothetical protein
MDEQELLELFEKQRKHEFVLMTPPWLDEAEPVKIDKGIAKLIGKLWALDIETYCSCQEIEPGRMNIGFMTFEGAEHFLAIAEGQGQSKIDLDKDYDWEIRGIFFMWNFNRRLSVLITFPVADYKKILKNIARCKGRVENLPPTMYEMAMKYQEWGQAYVEASHARPNLLNVGQ